MERISVEPVGDHEYLVRLTAGGRDAASWFRADPAVLDELGIGADKERRAVEQTAGFLVDRQDAQDLPKWVDLDDVVASYQDFPDELRRRLGTG
ncbi:hypothetical protein ACIGXM_09605 [Kitasatospora sp. NPDC052896]|uniref:hypothetical protein n=1 Tax=Kitasatospora sp. NPDC052896 TaxID=3364061 RepID=UPI0037C7335E